MSVEFYLKKITENEKLFLIQDRVPQFMNADQNFEKASDEVFSRKEIYNFMSYVGINSSSLKGTNYFYFEGQKFRADALILSDVVQIEISKADTELFTFSDLILPGYVFDWAQSKKGLVVFYGSDLDAVNKFSLSFAKFRIEQMQGSSLIFNSSDINFVGRDDHLVSFSSFQKEYLENSHIKSFDYVSYEKEIENQYCKKIMSEIDQGTLVSFPVRWSNISSTWGELLDFFKDKKDLKFFIEHLVGFVGVKNIETQKGRKEYFFEAIPFTQNFNDSHKFIDANYDEQISLLEEIKEKQGYSFNQSIQAMLLKRRILLESAYEASPNPQELNDMLTQVGF